MLAQNALATVHRSLKTHNRYGQVSFASIKGDLGKLIELEVKTCSILLEAKVRKYCYAREKLYLAVRSLAHGEGDARSRLREAFIYHLIHIHSEDLPPSDWKSLKKIHKSISRKSPPDYLKIGAIDFTLRSLKNKTASRYIRKILEISEKLKVLTLVDD